MDFKSNIGLLAEAAINSMKINTQQDLDINTVIESYSVIPDTEEMVVTEASDVVITKTMNGDYYVELANLAPFMKDSGITDIAEAMSLVAESNDLLLSDLTLCIESQAEVDSFLEAAKKKSKKTGDSKYIKNAVKKVDMNNKAAAKLMKSGIKVAKKRSSSKVCPKCGKVASKCKCESNISTLGGYADA